MTKKYFTRLLQASLMCCLAVLFTACDDYFGSESNPTPAYLSMSDKPVTIKVGETFLRQATYVPTAVIEYTSSDTKIATVDNTGLVTAIAEGETTISATATGYSSQTGKKIYLPDSKSYKLTVESAGPAATITTAPVATAATISAGSATALVTAGEADGGTMMYQVTATNTKPTTTDGFSATVPTAATLAAGTYYVWYYAKGDATHSNSKIAGPVEVTLIDGYAANEYNYAEWDYGDKKVIFTKKTAASVTAVTNSDTDVTWGDGWYTVSGNVTIKGKVTLSAHTSLILQDGATLTINGQLNAASSYDLYIYGQAEGTGKLNVTCNDDDALYGAPGYCLRIHGGEITATTTGATHRGVYFGYIAIFSGKLTATAADCYAIGFNAYGFEVYGGEVEATSNATSDDGIQSSGPLRVYVGKVKGTGGAPSGKGFNCKVQSGTSNIKFYFSDNGTTWGSGLSYGIAGPALDNRYAKAE